MDGKLFWCRLQELAPNCSCLLLAHNPSSLPVTKACKQLDTSSLQPRQLLLVDSVEPVKLLTCLNMGPQHAAVPQPARQKQVCQHAAKAVPAGVCCSSLCNLRQSPSAGLLPSRGTCRCCRDA